MAIPFHVVVWLDHVEARLYSFSRSALVQQDAVFAPGGLGHVHHKAGSPGPGHVDVSTPYLQQIADRLSPEQEILIVGPGDAKFALKRHLQEKAPKLAARIVAVEPVERIDGGELHQFATRIFRRADLMGILP